jgi:hypothetical protein
LYLTPAARRKPKIHDRLAGFEQAIFIIDLEQLESRPALQALDFGFAREAVGCLPANPLLR